MQGTGPDKSRTLYGSQGLDTQWSSLLRGTASQLILFDGNKGKGKHRLGKQVTAHYHRFGSIGQRSLRESSTQKAARYSLKSCNRARESGPRRDLVIAEVLPPEEERARVPWELSTEGKNVGSIHAMGKYVRCSLMGKNVCGFCRAVYVVSSGVCVLR